MSQKTQETQSTEVAVKQVYTTQELNQAFTTGAGLNEDSLAALNELPDDNFITTTSSYLTMLENKEYNIVVVGHTTIPNTKLKADNDGVVIPGQRESIPVIEFVTLVDAGEFDKKTEKWSNPVVRNKDEKGNITVSGGEMKNFIYGGAKFVSECFRIMEKMKGQPAGQRPFALRVKTLGKKTSLSGGGDFLDMQISMLYSDVPADATK
jgi:hypothetical protein